MFGSVVGDGGPRAAGVDADGAGAAGVLEAGGVAVGRDEPGDAVLGIVAVGVLLPAGELDGFEVVEVVRELGLAEAGLVDRDQVPVGVGQQGGASAGIGDGGEPREDGRGVVAQRRCLSAAGGDLVGQVEPLSHRLGHVPGGSAFGDLLEQAVGVVVPGGISADLLFLPAIDLFDEDRRSPVGRVVVARDVLVRELLAHTDRRQAPDVRVAAGDAGEDRPVKRADPAVALEPVHEDRRVEGERHREI